MRAVLLCAGEGRRCRPVTLFRPKPLIPVKGAPLIEHQLHFLHEHHVRDVTIITGHCAEQFAYLEKLYGVRLRHNPDFMAANNSSSLRLAVDLLDDCLVLDGDLFFLQDWMVALHPGVSQFVVQPTTQGVEWEVSTEKSSAGLRLRGVNKWSPCGDGLVGVSYWTGEAARLLAQELGTCSPEDYWEDAALRILDRTPIYVTPLSAFVQEIDTLLDARNFGLLDDDGIASLCSMGMAPQKLKGLTNSTYCIQAEDGSRHVLRIPGKGTEFFIDRAMEPAILSLIKNDAVTPSTFFYNDGFKISTFLNRHRVSDGYDMDDAFFKRLAALLSMLHAKIWNQNLKIRPLFIRQEMAKYEERERERERINNRSSVIPSNFPIFSADAKRRLSVWAETFDQGPCVLCHRDLLLENILVAGEAGCDMQLIDFEYAGFTHPLWDTASFILEAELTGETRHRFFEISAPAFNQESLLRMEILVDYIWGLWGYVNGYCEYGEKRLQRAKNRLEICSVD